MYIHLHTMGPSRASSIADVAGLSRPQTYRILETLVRRGFVRSLATRPISFAATPPSILFRQLAKEAHASAQRIEAAALELVPRLEPLEGSGGAGAGPVLEVVRGRRAIMDHLFRMMAGARSSLEVAATLPTGAAISGRTLRALPESLHGLQVRVVVASLDEFAQFGARRLLQTRAEVRILDDVPPLLTAVVDAQETLVRVTGDLDPRGRNDASTAVRTDDHSFVLSQRQMFEGLWSRAQPVHGTGDGNTVQPPAG